MSDRSDREREAARLERERRRAEREGVAPPAPPEVPAAAPPSAADHRRPAEAPEAAMPAPPAAEAPEAAMPPPPATEAPEARPAPPAASTPAPAAPPRRKPLAKPRPAVPPRRPDPPVTAPGAQPGAAGMPRHPLSIPPRRRRRSPARVAVLGGLLALLVVLIGFFVFSIFTPFKGDGSGRVVVRIPTGSSAREVGNLLADKGVVGSGLFFSLRATIGGDRDKLRAGRFVLHHDMSNGAALSALTTAPKATPVTDVLIPEGPGRREVAPLVAKAGVEGDYLAATRRSTALNPRSYGAPRRTPSLEGFLFPATYRLKTRRTGADARDRAAAGVRAQHRHRQHAPGAREEPDRLRRADHRLDGRA